MVNVLSPGGSVKFQSTHPQGVRLGYLCERQSFQQVSIHAPAGGATIVAGVASTALLRFQSTHPQGVRRYNKLSNNHLDQFQSTHPQGVRQTIADTCQPPVCCFNPRTRRGCDVTGFSGYIPLELFQSTHPQGVRL